MNALCALALFAAACPRPPVLAFTVEVPGPVSLPPSLYDQPADCVRDDARAFCQDPGTRAGTCGILVKAPAAVTACNVDPKSCAARLAQACREEDHRRRVVAEQRWERWTSHMLLRVGEDGRLGVEPEQDKTTISRNLHYISIALDRVVLKNMAGFYPAEPVVLGLEVTGLLAGVRGVRTVFEPALPRGDDARVVRELPVRLAPLLYSGQNITLTVHAAGYPRAAFLDLRQRLGGMDYFKQLDPKDGERTAKAGSYFAEVFDRAAKEAPRWKYSLTLYPADLVYRDKPDQLMLEGRVLMVMMPPSSASPALKERVNRQKLVDHLTVREGRLVDKVTGADFDAAPYLLLTFKRFERYPLDISPIDIGSLRQLGKRADALIDGGESEAALPVLDAISAALNGDPQFTVQDKNLERAFNEVRRARVFAERARIQKNHRAQVQHLRELVKLQDALREDFAPLLLREESERLVEQRRVAIETLKSLGAPAP